MRVVGFEVWGLGFEGFRVGGLIRSLGSLVLVHGLLGLLGSWKVSFKCAQTGIKTWRFMGLNKYSYKYLHWGYK